MLRIQSQTSKRSSRAPRSEAEARAREPKPVSLPHHFHDYPLIPLSIELRIENPLPRTQVELARSNRHDDFMVNQQRLQMRIPIVLAGFMMFVVFAERRQMLQPPVDVLDQSA